MTAAAILLLLAAAGLFALWLTAMTWMYAQPRRAP